MATAPAGETNVDVMENESLFMACFDDILNLLDLCDEEAGNNNQGFIGSIINRLELAVKFVDHVSPLVNECRNNILEVGNNLNVLFHVWCRKLQEIGQRSNTHKTRVIPNNVCIVISTQFNLNCIFRIDLIHLQQKSLQEYVNDVIRLR